MGESQEEIRWVSELRGIHESQAGFVLGNGYSIEYYDSEKMRGKGVLIGCNNGYERHRLHYLIWQDPTPLKNALAWKEGIKVSPYSRARKSGQPIDYESTYFYTIGQYNIRGQATQLEKCHTGGLALQLAHWMGCDPIVLVGCDCCFLEENGKRKSNIFNDKQAKSVEHKESKVLTVRNRETTEGLLGFAQQFNRLYETLSLDREIFCLGSYSITKIPTRDFKEFHSERNPNYGGKG